MSLEGSFTVSLNSQSGQVRSNYCSNVSFVNAFGELGKRSFTVSLTSQSGRLCSNRCSNVSFDIL